MKLFGRMMVLAIISLFIGAGAISSLAMINKQDVSSYDNDFLDSLGILSSVDPLITPRIDEIIPNPVEYRKPVSLKGGFRIVFDGSGKTIDSDDDSGGYGNVDDDNYAGIGDEYIKTFLWSSDKDGVLSDRLSFSTFNLSVGTHTVYFSICSQNGVWTPPCSKEITVIKSDLYCSGSLNWNHVEPNSLVTASFTVRNGGDDGSGLNWKIQSYPSWGDWTFTPRNGDELQPSDGPITVDVFVVAPEVEESTFSGEILVINEDDSSDFEKISVSLATPRNINFNNHLLRFIEKFYCNYPEIIHLLNNILDYTGGDE